MATFFFGNVCCIEIFIPLQRGSFHNLSLDQDFPPIKTYRYVKLLLAHPRTIYVGSYCILLHLTLAELNNLINS